MCPPAIAEEQAGAAESAQGADHVGALAAGLLLQGLGPQRGTGVQTVQPQHAVDGEVGADDECHGPSIVTRVPDSQPDHGGSGASDA